MIKLNGEIIKPTIFPDKTSQVWLLNDELLDQAYRSAMQGFMCYVKWDFEAEAELIHVLQLIDLLRSKGIADSNIRLEMPFLPYGRQDKHVSNSSTFGLYTFMNILNKVIPEVEKVTFDAHSTVAEQIKNLRNDSPMPEISSIIQDLRHELNISLILCYPDKGSRDRYNPANFEKVTSGVKDVVVMEKTRNQLTGALEMAGVTQDLTGQYVLIIDDLCDYGNTFILAAKELYKAGAKEVYLYVSHGIFSGGINVLFKANIKRIFTKHGEM